MEKEVAKKAVAELEKALERTDLTEEERSDIQERSDPLECPLSSLIFSKINFNSIVASDGMEI